MKEIIKLGIILLVISMVASSALAYTYEITLPKITEQRALASEAARMAVFPDAETFEAVDEGTLNNIIGSAPLIKELFFAKIGSENVGFVFKATPSGFGGPIEVIVGMDIEGNITGMRIGSHTETPGLGTNAALPYFYDQYNGRSLVNEILVSKAASSETEILAITGATITSQAVTDGVNQGKLILENMK
jgi:electron transport complex protein RnfG